MGLTEIQVYITITDHHHHLMMEETEQYNICLQYLPLAILDCKHCSPYCRCNFSGFTVYIT